MACKSFGDTIIRLIFVNRELVDDNFFNLLRREEDPFYQKMLCEAVLQSIGLHEDPEIIGHREQQIITQIVTTIVPPAGPAWLLNTAPTSIPYQDIEVLLELATEGMAIVERDIATRLAIVYYAMRFVSQTTPVPGAPDTSLYLCALGNITRGRILAKTQGRAFDALQYLRRGMSELEGQYGNWQGTNKKHLESLLTRLSIEIINLKSYLETMENRL